MRNKDFMWSVKIITTGIIEYFARKEDAITRCFELEGVAPCAMYKPKYYDEYL